MFKSAKAVIVVLALLVAVGIGYGVKQWIDNKNKTVKTTSVTIDQIKKIAQLSTVEYYVSTFVQVKKGKAWYEWKYAKFIVFLKGMITGSVDLEAADIRIPTDTQKKHVIIKFKKTDIKISNPAIGPNDISVITVSDPQLFHPITDEDRNKATADAITELMKVAKDNKIEYKTAEQAKKYLSGFLDALGYTSEIKFDGMDI
jgi:hypothetical protein